MHSNVQAPSQISFSRRPRWALHVARALILVFGWSNLQLAYNSVAGLGFGPAPAYAAGPIADPSAALAFRPGIGQAANGVPVVNITAPNAAGLSLNKYQSFNVDSQGVILNNSLQGGNALLGAGVSANANLVGAGRTAQTIVNEVSTNGAPSLLSGTIETFGAPAAVIVANPNGVTCAGCGVLNTPRFTLATGTPLLRDHLGQPTGFATAQQLDFDILGGQLFITGQGVEGTSRDPKTANGALTNTLTLQQAAQIVGGALDNVIGDLGAQNGWKEGSAEKTLLHGLSGVVQAALGGTSALSGFAAGVVNEQIMGAWACTWNPRACMKKTRTVQEIRSLPT